MVKKLVFKNLTSNIIHEEKYNYQYPEDWEFLMDTYDVLKWVKLKGYKINTIHYNPQLKTLTYRCQKIRGGK